MSYDLFISYCRRDNHNHRITELKDRIAADYFAFAGEKLSCFFDIEDIHGMDDWRHRILAGLRESSLLVLVLSPGYLTSKYCEWEIVEYLKYEHSRAVGGQGVAPVYFVEVPGLNTPGFEQEAAAWMARVRRRNHFDLRPWHDEGVEALKREDVRARLTDLEDTLHHSILKMRRSANAPGNLAAPNAHFVGRETEMLRLHEATGLGCFGVLTVLQGMGGLGKTALAIQYAHAYADFYPGGRWLVGCAGKTSLAAVIRELHVNLGITLSDEEKVDDTRAARRVLVELETRTRNGAIARAGEKDPPEARALLLLDNVDDPALLRAPQADLISGMRWLHVIATTRLDKQDIGNGQTLLAVDELPLNDAVLLIESHQPHRRFPNDEERAAAFDLAELVAGFTLAVEAVAVHLGERRGEITCAAFLHRLQREGLGGLEKATMATKTAPGRWQNLICATLSPTLDLLLPEPALVLAYAALLPPDTLPLPWLRSLIAKDHPALGQDAAPGYDDPWLSLVNHLLGLRLFQVVDQAPDTHAPRIVRMHRLVAELVRERSGSEVLNILQQAINALICERAFALANVTHWEEVRWELPPLGDLGLRWGSQTSSGNAASAERYLPVPQTRYVSEFLNQIALRWGELGDWKRAERLYQRGLALGDMESSDDCRRSTISHLSNYSLLLRDTDRPTEALQLVERALTIGKLVYGDTDEQYLVLLNNQADIFRSIGEFRRVEGIFREIIQLAESNRETPMTNLASYYGNLALTLHQSDQKEEAERLYRKSLALTEQSGFGAGTTVAGNLGHLLLATGRRAEAEELMRKSLRRLVDKYGADEPHPEIANALKNLGTCLISSNPGEAERRLDDALEMQRQVYGMGHPGEATILNNLAKLKWEAGKTDETRKMLTKALEILLTSVQNVEHPEILEAVNNLNVVLQKSGYDELQSKKILTEVFKNHGYLIEL